MAETVKLAKFRRSRNKAVKAKAKPPKDDKGRKWRGFSTRAVPTPLAAEMAWSRQVAPPRAPGRAPLLESGVLAFRREGNGETMVLLISKRHSKKWGIPKGRIPPHQSFQESAAREAFEEAGVIGGISPSPVGMFRAEKSTANPLVAQIIEVWVYLLEVTEALPRWPERGKRAIRWVSCEVAARQLREPVLTHLCHRLAQG
jgi:8-oxo-dGTP pyrophosphatase MutT (NUDIX family)